MKNDSDEHDYEDTNSNVHDNDGNVKEMESFTYFLNNTSTKKRKLSTNSSDEASHSDANSTDGNEDGYEEKADVNYRSQNMYQNLTYEQDTAIGSNSPSMSNRFIDDATLKHESEKRKTKRASYENNYHPNKRCCLEPANKADDHTIIKNENYNRPGQSSKSQSKMGLQVHDKAKKMMAKMGYTDGEGLGKHKQGRVEPVEASKQHGRRGLGHHLPGLEASGHKWNAEEEEIKVIEDMEWLVNKHTNLPSAEQMFDRWLQKGPQKLTIDDETHFCHEDIVRDILKAKVAFDSLDGVEMRNARRRCNPYETIHGAFFLNRAAVKMANMDRACDFMFTNACENDRELLYFADVCAGPGGFSEYVLWRKKWRAKGFGFTLKNENDFKLGDFYAGSCETFHPYYGPKRNGDVFDPENQEAFKNLIMEHTNGKGVHFMMSDGGFSVEGRENIQEILSKQLYLCQCLVALMIVRTHGHFVTKLFDVFTPFSAGLVYLMYRCFDEVCIFKPNSSRPANSERYLICKRKRPCTENIVQYLKHVNHILLKGESHNDVSQLVSFDELERETNFLKYLRKSNDSLGQKQIVALHKIAAFCEDTALVETKQAEMRVGCLDYWKIPDESRRVPRFMKPEDRIARLINKPTATFCAPANKLTKENMGEIIKSPYDWFCMPCGANPQNDYGNEERENATFYLGAGRGAVYRYERGAWTPVTLDLELPPNTLVYAELVYEMRGESTWLQKVFALHILDAVVLGGEDISQEYITKRHRLIKLFCEALRKPKGSKYVQVRAKDLLSVKSNLCEKLKLTSRRMKKGRPAWTFDVSETHSDSADSNNDKPYFKLSSIIFFKSTSQIGKRCFSKKHNFKAYICNTSMKESYFQAEVSSTNGGASFTDSFKNRYIWYYPSDQALDMQTFSMELRKYCDINDQYFED